MMMMMMMNYTLDLRQTFWRVANGRGSVLLWRRLDKLASRFVVKLFLQLCSS